MICDNLSVSPSGSLLFAGQDTVSLAAQYGTPLYLMDENKIRSNCIRYIDAFREVFPSGSRPFYASKACAFKQIYEIMQQLGMGIDVVSPGEIYTARSAGFDMKNARFHGNATTDSDIAFAMDCGIGCFVADSVEILEAINAEACRRNFVQPVMLRITPGIDPHTYAAIATGQVDSKFGIALETGQALDAVIYALKLENVKLCGLHCHVGSMVFDEDVYERTADIMLGFMAEIKRITGCVLPELDLGGGYGVRYTESDPEIDIPDRIISLGRYIRQLCDNLGIDVPIISMEPGRSIVADAGLTLYTVSGVKRITGYKNYCAVDGGMADNPRYALYGSNYTCLSAGKMNDDCTFHCDLVGRCCESGDILQPDILLPESTSRGDIVAVCTTGAYNHSMSSNYNSLLRPPIVILKDGVSYAAVRRETYEDLCIRNL